VKFSIHSFINISLYKNIRKLYRRIKNIPRHPLQDIPTAGGIDFVHLGSEYGGWTFVDDVELQGCTIISAGLGEDASFDVEFAQKYGARVVVVDPTPRAIKHFKEITLKFGQVKSQIYSCSGKQPIDAYDLSNLSASNFVLIKKALWHVSTKLKFFEPANSENVSHSIVNFQHNYKEDTPHIEVETTTLPELLLELSIEPYEISLIKLDIEGAEIEVLTHFLSQGITPKQILVEFDELNVPSSRGFTRVDQMHKILIQNGYEMIRTDGQADFLYILRN